MANTYLSRTFGTETNRKIWTWSAWVKRTNLVANYQNALFAAYENSSNRSVIRFQEHRLNFQDTDNSVEIKTNRLFRDTSAWYHIVVRVDTTQGTASNRVRMYVNGVQETSFNTANYPDQNDNMKMNANCLHYINARSGSGSVESIASMVYSHVHFSDGSSLAPTVFGSTDSTTGEWKINTSPSFTPGNNGFTILKDGNGVADVSANSNNWTIGVGSGGGLSKTQDNPSNVFATLNALAKPGAGNLPSFGNGNTHYNKTGTGSGNNSMVVATLGATTGKFYYEYKMNDSNAFIAGISTLDGTYYDANGGSMNTSQGVGVAYQSSGNKIINGTSSSYGSSYGSGNIIGVAFDLANNFIYFSKNGTFQNSGNPTSGSSGTGGIAIATTGITYAPFAQNNGYNSPSSIYYNFGNGYFGTTAVASAGTNASNNGIFEYDVPTGYTALSTKGLNL